LLDALPIVVSLVCIGLFAFLSGGYIFVRSAPIAIVYLLLAAVWMWIVKRRSRPPALFLAALAAFALFVGWIGLSTLWSFGPDLSWMAFDVAALYLVVMAVAGCTPVGRLQLRLAGWGFLVVATAVGVYAFLGKGLPDVVRHAYTFARLDSPVGYWNVLALVMVMGIVVALSFAGDGRLHPLARAAAAAAAVPMTFTFFFTFSRGGWVALAVALIAYFAFTTSRLASLASLVVVVAPAAVAIWRVRGLETLFTATSDAALRAAQGHTLLRWAVVALVVTAGVQSAVAFIHAAVAWPRWSRIAAGAAVLAILIGLSAGASWRYLAPRGGRNWIRDRVQVALDDADTRSTANQAARLVSLNTGRPPLWREAMAQSRHVRLVGTGAGTFAFTHYRFRDHEDVVRHAHSQWFNVLSELGVVGLVLFVAALVLALAACIRNPFTGRGDPLHPLVVAFQAGVLSFIVHISWDWDWDMAAAGTIVFLFVGLTASYLATRAPDDRRAEELARERAGSVAVRLASDAPASEQSQPEAAGGDPRRSRARVRGDRRGAWPLRVIASTALVLLAVSWALPYQSARSTARAVSAAGRGRPAVALEHARHAARLDPLAVEPLIGESLSLQQLGRDREALAALRSAQALQPDNFEVYYQEGRLQLKAFGRRQAALKAFRRALALNPLDADTLREVEVLLGS
jgi:Flp pilus assembly protein TadD